MSILIIDISYYQKPENINYDLLYSQVDGVIGRIGYGTGAPGKFVGKDPAWERHYAEAKARGIPVGGYHYMVEYKPVDEQLAVVFGALEGKELELGFWADVELEAGAPALTRNTVIEYMTKAEAKLGTIGIYTAGWCWNPIMGTNNPYSSRKLWVAAYTASVPKLPNGWTKYWMWQYTSSGRLDGYYSSLDMNRISEENWKAWTGIDVPIPEPEPIPVPTPPLTKLYYPCDPKWPITQLFGLRPNTYTISRGHNGVDWGIPVGNPIYCAWDGTVEVARADTNGYGRHVRIRHSHGLTIYGHLSRIDVKVGDKVKAKQIVGLSGGATSDPYSGFSSGPHLHFEYRLDIPVVPLVPGSYAYNAVDVMPLLVLHEEEKVLFRAKCITPALNVRSGPDMSHGIVGRLVAGNEVSVYEVHPSNGWFRIGVGRWCSGHTLYMERLPDPVIPDPPQNPVEMPPDALDRLWSAHPELHQ